MNSSLAPPPRPSGYWGQSAGVQTGQRTGSRNGRWFAASTSAFVEATYSPRQATLSRVGAGDNATMESSFSLLQRNVLDRRRWTTREECASPSSPGLNAPTTHQSVPWPVACWTSDAVATPGRDGEAGSPDWRGARSVSRPAATVKAAPLARAMDDCFVAVTVPRAHPAPTFATGGHSSRQGCDRSVVWMGISTQSRPRSHALAASSTVRAGGRPRGIAIGGCPAKVLSNQAFSFSIPAPSRSRPLSRATLTTAPTPASPGRPSPSAQ